MLVSILELKLFLDLQYLHNKMNVFILFERNKNIIIIFICIILSALLILHDSTLVPDSLLSQPTHDTTMTVLLLSYSR